jgi:hypothetical protein
LIGFFKIYDPIRLVMILVLLLLVRVPLLLFDFPLLRPELSWFLIGEKINDGWVMYKGVDDNTGVLSSIVYAFVNFVAGRSTALFDTINIIVVFIQAILLNFTINENNLLKTKTYVPALLYVVVTTIFFDFYTLSPPMMATTFLIISLRYLFQQMKQQKKDSSVFMMGFYVGVAGLFYTPAILFIFLLLFSVLLYSSSSLRSLFLVFVGFLFPLITVGLYYYWNNALALYLNDILVYSFTELNYWYLPLEAILFLSAIPTALTIWAIVRLFSGTGYVNYQVNARSVMLFYIVIAVITFFVSPKKSTFHLFLFVPALAYILGDYFLNIKSNVIQGLQFISFFVLVWSLGYMYDDSPFLSNNFVSSKNIVVDAKKYKQVGKILVLGDDVDYYMNNTLATGYLNWQVAKQHFKDLSYLPKLSTMHKSFLKELPDAIIDKEGVIPKVFDRLPDLKALYVHSEDGIYYRIEKEH